MQYDVYIDQVFIINLIYDSYLILLTLALTRTKTTPLRFLSGVFLSAFMGVIPFLMSILMCPMLLLLYLGIGSILLALVFENSLSFFCTWILVNIISGGACGISLKFGSPIYGMTLVPIGIFLIKVLRRQEKVKNMIYQYTILFGKKRVSGYGLYDTGNHLYDPLYQLPVVITNYETIWDILPKEYQGFFEAYLVDCKTSLIKNTNADKKVSIQDKCEDKRRDIQLACEDIWKHRNLRMITCNTVTGREILPGFLAEIIVVDEGKGFLSKKTGSRRLRSERPGCKKLGLRKQKVVVVCTKEKIGEGQIYDLILHPDL